MLTIRRAEQRDARALGALGAALMRTHYAFDPQRFLAAGEDAERGYAAFLSSLLEDDDAVVLIAEVEGMLRDAGFAHVRVDLKSNSDALVQGWSPGAETLVASALIRGTKPRAGGPGVAPSARRVAVTARVPCTEIGFKTSRVRRPACSEAGRRG